MVRPECAYLGFMSHEGRRDKGSHKEGGGQGENVYPMLSLM